jgi:hypothetical protein
VEELAHPGSLCHAFGHKAILSLCDGAGDDGLPLGGPGDEVGTKEHDIAQGGPARVGAPTQLASVYTTRSDVEDGRRRRP